MSRVGFTYF